MIDNGLIFCPSNLRQKSPNKRQRRDMAQL
jgi:hypothetical protein